MPCTVAIVGLGTAGAATAALCARRGLKVIGLERGPLGSAGARWVNTVPEWAFHQAGLAPPEAPELRDQWERVYLVAGWGPARVALRGALAVDMRYLVERLQSIAEDAGAELHPGVAVHRFDGAGLETSNGRVEADIYVDASGLAGARLLDQPRVPAVDLCVAAQQVRELRDRDAARTFFLRHRARQGDTLVFTGIAGGYSIVEVRFDDEQVALLTGSIPALGYPSASVLLERFVAEHSWIGGAVFGGSRPIPLRRALPRVGRDRVAAIGDAAFQLYSAHGSGIGQQLVAARVLADALARGRGAEGYNREWQRGWGGAVASADLVRRFAQRFSVGEVARMMERRVLGEEVMQQALFQQPPHLSARSALRSARGLARLPRVARYLAPLLARMRLVQLHYRRYPVRPDRIHGWTRRLEIYSGIPEA